jgi:methionine synthase II (cobalamin-independent)
MADERVVPLPVGLSTGIGSLPHCDPSEAVEFALRHAPRLPFAPSLPARSRREGMIAQAASGIAGIDVTVDGSLVFEERDIDPEAPLLDPFFTSDSFVGLRAFLTAVADNTGPIKVSLTGPVTLGVALHAAGLDPDLAFRLAGATTRARARALLDLVEQRVPQSHIVVFVDEPSLVALTERTFPIGPLEAVDLVSGTLADIETRATAGLHCCGAADWKLLLQSGPQILSLPIDGGRAELAGATLGDHLERGGWIAWGAVPTDRPVGSSVDRLWRQLSLLWRDLVGAGCDPARLRTQALITPACGLATHGVTQAEQVMEFAARLAERLHDQAVGARLSIGA